MRPKERRGTGQADIFRSRLDQIIDMDHPLVRLARKIDWGFLEAKLGAVYTDRPGRPPLPTRLMAGVAILKAMHDLSDEALCADSDDGAQVFRSHGAHPFREYGAQARTSLAGLMEA